MAIDLVTLALAKKYTKRSLVGLGALKGAPAEVKSIISDDTKTTVTMEWTSKDTLLKEQKSFEIYNGKGITNITIDDDAHLQILLSDGSKIDAGLLPGMEGNVTQAERDRWDAKQDKLIPKDNVSIDDNTNEISVDLDTIEMDYIDNLFDF